MQIIKVILFGLIGFFLAYEIINMIELGYLVRWGKKVSPTEQIYEYFLAKDNNQSHQGGLIITNPCDYSKPEFSIISNSPKNIVKCVQLTFLYPEGESRDAYVLDENGIIWGWSHLIYINLGLLICCPLIGLLVGVIISIFTKKPKQAKAFSAG